MTRAVEMVSLDAGAVPRRSFRFCCLSSSCCVSEGTHTRRRWNAKRVPLSSLPTAASLGQEANIKSLAQLGLGRWIGESALFQFRLQYPEHTEAACEFALAQ